jgi:hypothetical protein
VTRIKKKKNKNTKIKVVLSQLLMLRVFMIIQILYITVFLLQLRFAYGCILEKIAAGEDGPNLREVPLPMQVVAISEQERNI